MGQAPGFHGLVVAILGLGIAASVAVFSLVDGVVLHPFPYPGAGRLVAITATATAPPFDSNGSFRYSDFESLRSQAHSFEDIAVAYRSGAGQAIVTAGGERERLRGGFVSPNFFAIFGRPPLLGRTFTDKETVQGERLALLGERLAARRFGSPAAALGHDLEINGSAYRIIGIMPADFRVPFLDTQFWAPVTTHWEWNDKKERRAALWDMLARLRPGTGIRRAQAEADAIYAQIRKDNPIDHEDRALLVPLREHFTGPAGRPLIILGAAVTLLLLIALANAGNLLLARSAARQREFAIRAALGAGSGRLLRQVITETLSLCLLAGGCGAALSFPLVRVLKTFTPAGTPRLDEVGINLRVLTFAVAISIAAGVSLALIAVWRGQRRSGETLKAAGRGATTSRETRRMKNLLVASEFALAMMLLTGAALLVRSFTEVLKVDVGFRPQQILTLQVNTVAEGPELARYYREAVDRLRGLPGVQAAGFANYVFEIGLTRTHALRFVEGHPPEPTEQWGMLEWSRISGDFFQAMGIPLLRGRYFDERDGPDVPPVAIVNETLARRYWPGEDPIGKRLKGQDPRGPNGGKNDDWVTVVGLVRDIRAAGRERQPISQIYEYQKQSRELTPMLVIRTPGNPAQVASAARAALSGIDRSAKITAVATMEHILEEQQTQRLFQTWLIGVFSAIALGLAALGVFAVMHFSVAAKTREIGIRMAVGARSVNIARLVIGDGARLAATGIAAGAIGSVWTNDVLSGLLFGVKATDPASFGAAAALLAVVSVMACWLPARRAARLDPVAALREE
jgi:putative ABC transport system permease protein